MDEGLLSPVTRLGPVHLRVTDVPAALNVWRDVLGLALLGEDAVMAGLGAGGRTLIVLHAGAETPLPQKARGLFHVAIHVTSRRDLPDLCTQRPHVAERDAQALATQRQPLEMQ